MKLRHLRPTRVLLAVYTFLKNHLLLIISLFILLLCLFLGLKGYAFLKKENIKAQDLLSFFGTPQENLDSTNGVTNFLLLGIRGEGSDSPDLADTIIIASYNHSTHQTTLISIPRDLWVPSLKTKINATYYYGQIATPAAGIKMAQAAILETIGLPVHYTAVVNFSLFKDVVDLLGGIDVVNDTAFTDNLFPIPGQENALPISARYETISFPAGLIHLDGTTALKFVRSRHAAGEEGTDFARSRRQQAVITALRKQILAANFLLDQNKVNHLMDIINHNLSTNLAPGLYPTLAKIALDTKDNPLRSLGLSDQPDDKGVTILYNPPTKNYSGEYVLIPKDNNYPALQKYLDNKLSAVQ